MRLLTSLPDKKLAQRLSDVLLTQGIKNQFGEESAGGPEIWIIDEDQMERAEALLRDFLGDPNQDRYQAAHAQAQMLRLQNRRAESQSRSKVIDLRTHWHRYNRQIGPVTLTLILISVAVGLLTQLGRNTELLSYLYMTDYQVAGGYLRWRAGFSEILHGQVWRLWTPLFIHSGLLHLLFNMLWLKDLGTMIEKRQGSFFLILQVAVIGLASNFSQYFWSGPNFGGMSGVVYGLLGYIWIRERFDPWCGLSLNPGVVTMMIVWFFLCMTGLIGNVANAAHAGGLVSGMLWGFLAAKLGRRGP
jgi:Uncharacterized membrane protein (homolog of Drosophila rhomboid)